MTLLRLGLCPELNADLLQKLKLAGVTTVVNFLEVDLDFLARKASVAYKTLSLIRRALVSNYAAKCRDGLSFCERQLSGLAIFTTGCQEIDMLLDGGIYSGEVTEIWGQAGVGKTQFCFCTTAAFLLNTQRTVLYVDTCGGYSASRVLEIIEHQGCTRENVSSSLERVKYVRLHNIHDLISLFEDGKQWLEKFGPSLAVVIIDSIHALLSPILGGNSINGMSITNHVAQTLKSVAVSKMIAIVVCNSAVHNNSVFKPALGRFWSYVPSVSIGIEVTSLANNISGCQLKGNKRIFSLTKSCRQATGSQIICHIKKEGFAVVKD